MVRKQHKNHGSCAVYKTEIMALVRSQHTNHESLLLWFLQHKNHGSCVATPQELWSVFGYKLCNKWTMDLVLLQYASHSSCVVRGQETQSLCGDTTEIMVLVFQRHRNHDSCVPSIVLLRQEGVERRRIFRILGVKHCLFHLT